MPRVKGGFKTRRRRKKLLNLAEGYYGLRRKVFSKANETVNRALAYAYRDRRNKKRDFRALWIQRINAATRMHGMNYSTFMHKLSLKNIKLDRKILAEIAATDSGAFEGLVKTANS